MPDLRQERIYFENSQPILRVDNIPSLRFYVDLLGFVNVDWGADEFTGVFARSSCDLPVQKGSRTWGRMGMDRGRRRQGLHEECKSRGVGIGPPPTILPWAMEMLVEDPDGNALRFGSEVHLFVGERKNTKGAVVAAPVCWRSSYFM